MPITRINNTELAKLNKRRPAHGQVFYWDEELKGFGAKLTPSGIIFVVQRKIDGKAVRHRIGKFGELSPAEARNKAAAALANLRDGIDLNVEKKQKQKREEAERTTLTDIFNDYVSKRELRSTTRRLYDSLIRLYLQELFEMPVMDISKDMIEKKLQTLANEPGTRGDRAAQAAQCFRLLRGLLRFASEEYYVNGKPIVNLDLIKNVSKGKSWSKLEPRDTVIHASELAEWYQAVMTLESQKLRDFFLFLIFSGVRRGEAMQLQWAHFNTKTKVFTIPKELSKTSKKRQLPLTDVLLDIYKSRRAAMVVGNPYVFVGSDREIGGRNKGHLKEPKRGVVEVKKAVTKLRKKLNPKDESTINWSSHDLRRTYATIASKLDVSYYKLKYLLGHSVGGDVTGKHYAQVGVEDVVDAAQEVANYLKTQMKMKKLPVAEVG